MRQIITEEIKAKIDQLRQHLPTQQALVIPLLHAIQDQERWISMEAMEQAAEYLQLPVGQIQEVATFYTIFQQTKPGKHHIQVCTNIACYLNGADRIKKCAEEKLKIKTGETTPDGKFTLSAVECLAACGTGPAAQINDHYYENLTQEKMIEIIDTLGKE